MQFAPIAHLTGSAPRRVDLTTRLPWLYLIAAHRAGIIYVGETYDQGGLIVRLGSHFGSFPQSTLRKKVSEIKGISVLRPPFLVVAARLPFADDDAGYDAGSKKVRLACEALVQELVGKHFLTKGHKWTIVSETRPNSLIENKQIHTSCRSIYDCFENAFGFLENLSGFEPFNLILLDSPRLVENEQESDIGELIEQTEMLVFQWLLDKVKQAHGDMWWSDGIPETVRIECQKRREQEAASETLPKEAYLTLIDFRAIAQKNWDSCQHAFERIAEAQGKNRATEWIMELNDLRKLWAHPIKRYFVPLDAARVSRLRKIHERVCASLPEAKS